MINDIFKSSEELKSVVKINSSLPFDSLKPFISDALDTYIEPHIGNVVIDIATSHENPDDNLLEKIRRALGPLSLFLAIDEMSVLIGDGGITVANTPGTRSPANDSKIAAAKINLFNRGMQALDRLIDYLERNISKYPDYRDHRALSGNTQCIIKSQYEYQDKGFVNIEYSAMSYRTILPTILQLQERYIQQWVGEKYYISMLQSSPSTAIQQILLDYCIRYLANKSAELHTSVASRQERSVTKGNQVEYMPLIRPIYSDPQQSCNFFAEQADHYASKINSFIANNSAELGIPVQKSTTDFNSKDKKIFTTL